MKQNRRLFAAHAEIRTDDAGNVLLEEVDATMFPIMMVRQEQASFSHGWTRIHTDENEKLYPCKSVGIRGQNYFR